MKKSTVDNCALPSRGLYKLLIFMKFFTLFVLVACLHLSGAVRSQSKITFKVTQVQLEKALALLEKTSSYRFVYNDDNLPLHLKVSVDASDQPLDKVMEQLLSKTALRYRIMQGNLIVIAPAAIVSKDQVVKGKVVTSAGEALPGVTVRLKNTAIGVTTDAKGSFEIKVPENAMLIVSYIGFNQQEVSVNGKDNLTIIMEPSKNSMEEVIVVGYGTQKKINVTGAVDQISGKQLAERPIANVMQGLQGVSPGLNITYKGGAPGQTPKINIRGMTSLNDKTNAPLIIIDGITAATDDLMRLNPADIASISVLRDAASAAIYGARAAFGVLLITTKTGSAGGKQTVSYNNYFAKLRRTVMPEPVTDPYIFSRVQETSTNNTPWDYVNYSDEYYKWAKERSDNPSLPDTRLDPSDPANPKWAYMGSNNWNDYFFSKSNFSQYHSISLNGSAETAKKMPINYLLSADFTDENGLNRLSKDKWDRYGLRNKINIKPLSWLQVDNNLSIYQTKADAPANNITDVYYLQPTMVAVNPDGTWANTDAGRLAAKLVDGGRNTTTRFGFQNVIRGVASFLNNDLQITGDASFQREQWKYHKDSKNYKIGFGPNDIRQEGGTGYVSENNALTIHDVYDLYANYHKTLGHDHKVLLLAGFNQESYEWSQLDATKQGIISASLPYIGLTSGDAKLGTSYTAYGIRSYFGRINYTFKDRYIIEGNGRYDGSSRFPANKRWGFFPSVSGAWIASEENFVKSISRQLSTLKIRASYGNLGNQSVSDFGYIQTIPTTLSGYLIGGNVNQTVIKNAPPLNVDPNNYTWEKVTTANIGADMGFWENRLQATFDYYVRNTIGMLEKSAELPAVLGTSAPQQNSADLSTRGWELTIGYRNTINVRNSPLNFGVKVFVSDDKTKITRFKNDQLLLKTYREGQTLGEIWGLTNDGVFQNKDEINKLNEKDIVPWGALDIVPGWPKYKDLNHDGKIEKGITANDPKDLSIIGNSSPRYRFGINLDATWKGFDMSLFLQGIAKMDFYPRHYLFWGPYQQPYANIYPWNLDFYRATADDANMRAQHSQSYIKAGLADANTNAYFPVLQAWLADANYGSGLDIPQSKYLQNAAYLRVKNLTIGYTLPSSVLKRYHIARLRVFVSGENLFEFSAIKKYMDPESITDGYGWAYPYQRKYAVGINLDL